jgi:Zn-finger protein
MTSAIEKATNSIYKEISLSKYEHGGYYQLPIKKIDNIFVSCEFYNCHEHYLGFRIEIFNTTRINMCHDFITNITKTTTARSDVANTKNFIKNILTELPHYKFNKKNKSV